MSIFHPTYLILVAGVSNAFLAGDLFNLYVGFEILLVRQLRAAHPGRHRRADPGRRHVRRGPLLSSVLFLVAIAHDLRRHRHGQHGADLADQARRSCPRRPQLVLQVMLLRGLRHQGRGLPAVGLAARLLPDRAGAGHRGVRRPADQGRRLRDHPHRDAAVPRRRPSTRC